MDKIKIMSVESCGWEDLTLPVSISDFSHWFASRRPPLCPGTEVIAMLCNISLWWSHLAQKDSHQRGAAVLGDHHGGTLVLDQSEVSILANDQSQISITWSPGNSWVILERWKSLCSNVASSFSLYKCLPLNMELLLSYIVCLCVNKFFKGSPLQNHYRNRDHPKSTKN